MYSHYIHSFHYLPFWLPMVRKTGDRTEYRANCIHAFPKSFSGKVMTELLTLKNE